MKANQNKVRTIQLQVRSVVGILHKGNWVVWKNSGSYASMINLKIKVIPNTIQAKPKNDVGMAVQVQFRREPASLVRRIEKSQRPAPAAKASQADGVISSFMAFPIVHIRFSPDENFPLTSYLSFSCNY
jgi:hypothetical protein